MPPANLTCIQLHSRDNVAVTVNTISRGQSIGIHSLRSCEEIPSGHKVAIAPIDTDAAIIKYGQEIGHASKAIAEGEHVHVHNLRMKTLDSTYRAGVEACQTEFVSQDQRATFDAYVRSDGSAGTRNYIGVLPTVSCSSSVSQFIADAVGDDILAAYPNVDGVVALGHGSGCCLAPGSQGLDILQQTLAGYARNPNFGGVLVVGLGCEVNLVERLTEATGLVAHSGLKQLTIQAAGGTRKTVDAGVDGILKMLPDVNAVVRQPAPLSKLVVGLECGGSDAYSGITANPALGAAVDLLVRHGGTAILSETPEIYGAEHLLIRRAAHDSVANTLIDRIKWWEDYTSRHGAQLNNNPTPGNKAGGITTILEKSLGAVAKAGSTNLNAVYRYAQKVEQQGLVFMDTPGYDVVSITGMIAGGANLICFTTGRGTVCGFRPVPTLKLASNSAMYTHLSEDMDIDCGQILDGRRTLSEMGHAIFQTIIETASGRPTKSEQLGFGSNEFVPWPMGAIL